MKDRQISIKYDILPQLGEILLAVGLLVRQEKDLYENQVALQDLKEFLLNDAAKIKSASFLFTSKEFQRIVYEYTGRPAGVFAIRKQIEEDRIVNLYLFDFFTKDLWPIIVNRYIANVGIAEADAIKVAINVKKNVYTTIYGENESDIFFKELKQLLYDNYIIISRADLKSNGDMLMELLVPVVKN